jgi:hypothetical protein
VSLETSVAVSAVCGNGQGKLFQDKKNTPGILVKVNPMIYFKFKLQLKFRNNTNYCSIILNFHTGFR